MSRKGRKPVLFLRAAALAFLLLVVCGWTAAAGEENTLDGMYREQLEASGAEELWDALSPSARELMDRLGIQNLDSGSFASLTPEAVTNNLWTLLKSRAAGPLRSTGVLLGVVLLYALMDGLRQTVRDETVSRVFGAVSALTACAALMVPLAGCIQSVSRAAESVSVFMLSFVPVYAGVLLVSGQAAGAASYQTIVLFAAEVLSLIATRLIVPLMTVSLALGLVGSVAPGMKLGEAGGLIHRTAGWMLGLGATLFTGLLTLQSLVTGAADSLSGRVLKFSLSSFVPVVGGALGEAYSTVSGCLSLLKSTLGAFGIAATALTVLPPLLECGVWLLSLSLCTAAAELFALPGLAGLFKTAQGVLKTLVGVLSVCALFMIVATTVMTLAGGKAV